jgi:hypothetical protein
MLNPPPHLVAASQTAVPPQYAWDEWRTKEYYMFVQPELFAELNQLTNKANTALTNGIGEWICARFKALEPDRVPLQFLEAAWAGVIHPAYCEYTETTDDEWRGVIRAPLAVMIAIANDALFCLRDDPNVATRVCWMRNLAKHVLPADSAFDAWFEACVRRLQPIHGKAQEAEADSTKVDLFDQFSGQGRPVPREALDLGRTYDPAAASGLLDTFLSSLVVQANPFLRSAEEIATIPEFRHEPYRYVPD